jgi:hypothetical protein
MWVLSVALVTLWMALAVLGITFFGFAHLLAVGAVALEVLRQPAPRRSAAIAR